MIRIQDAQLDLFEALLPPELLVLNEELTNVDRLLQDERFMEPFMKRFSSKMGRPTISMQTFLRMMYLKFRYQLGFESLVKEVGDSLMWRRFCQIPLFKKGAVPHPTTLSKHAQVFGDELIRELNRLLVQKANEEKLIRARKLRIDTTVVESDIHYPTDASLLQDGVRVINRIAKAMKESSTELTSQIKDRSRTIRNKVFSINKVLKRRMQEAVSEVRQITGEILDVTQDVVRSGWTLLQEITEKAKSLPSKVINGLLPKLEQALETTEQILFQTQQVQKGNFHLPDRVVSIFDPQARPIQKGKLSKRTEFGYKVLLEETEDQIIVGYEVFEGNPSDDTLLNGSLDRFEETFERVPTAVATDRGFSSKSNEESLRQRGVKKISLPRKGKTSKERREFEKTSGFKRLQRFRAAGEATISVLKRCYGLRRSLFRGKQGTGAWTGYAIFAHNLNRLSRTMKQKSSKIVLQ